MTTTAERSDFTGGCTRGPTTPRKRGRPPKPEGRAQPGMHVSVPRDVAAQLSQIAEREGLYHGPAPSLAGAIRWLVEQDQERGK